MTLKWSAAKLPGPCDHGTVEEEIKSPLLLDPEGDKAVVHPWLDPERLTGTLIAVSCDPMAGGQRPFSKPHARCAAVSASVEYLDSKTWNCAYSYETRAQGD